MELSRFETLLDSHGPLLERWPEADRSAARALLDASEEAQALLAEGEALHAGLQALPADPASPLLRAAILDIPDLHGQGGGVEPGTPLGGRSAMAASLAAVAASAAIGFAVGAWWPSQAADWQSEDLLLLVYGATEIEEVLR